MCRVAFVILNMMSGLASEMCGTASDSLNCFLFAVLASVDFVLGICKYEDVRKFLLNGSYATRVLALDYIHDFLGEG